MKRMWLVALGMLLLTLPLGAQTGKVGAKYSSYATDLDVGFQSVETDRETSLGGFVDYRTGMWVFKGEFDSDSKSRADFGTDLTTEHSRDRIELLAGYGALPFMDLEAGLRFDRIDFTEFSFFDGSASNVSIDQRAAVFGLHFHTTNHEAFGWYGLVRAYLGTTDVTGSDNADSNGYRAETAFVIPIGSSGWEIAPGVELEKVDVTDVGGADLRFDTNRFFVKFGYNWGS